MSATSEKEKRATGERKAAYISLISNLYLPYISPISSLYLPYTPYISNPYPSP